MLWHDAQDMQIKISSFCIFRGIPKELFLEDELENVMWTRMVSFLIRIKLYIEFAIVIYALHNFNFISA
jgi:hypothetical protein